MKELVEKRNALVEELKTLTEAEEFDEKRFGEIDTELKSLDKQIEARQIIEDKAAQSAADAKPVIQTTEEREEAELRAFGRYVQGNLAQEDRADWTITANGAIIPTSIANRVIERIKDQAPIFDMATKFNSKGDLVFPVYDEESEITANYAEEFSTLPATAAKFKSVTLGGYLFAALTKLSKSLVNNSAIDVANFVIGKIGDSMAEFLRGELISGTGASHMHGILNSTNVVSASSITTDALIDLQLAVPQIAQDSAVWIMNNKTFATIKKLKLSTNEYILQMDLTAPMGYTILGKPVYIDEKMPDAGAGASPVVYGDLSGLYINIHEDISVQVLLELYAGEHAIGYVSWAEMASEVVEPQKIAVLTQPSE